SCGPPDVVHPTLSSAAFRCSRRFVRRRRPKWAIQDRARTLRASGMRVWGGGGAMRLFAGTTRRDWAMVAVVVVAATVQVSIGGPVRPAPVADLLGDVCALAGALALAW